MLKREKVFNLSRLYTILYNALYHTTIIRFAPYIVSHRAPGVRPMCTGVRREGSRNVPQYTGNEK